MTSTSGPGISLMAEFTGLAYYAELPAVIFDVQRVGPSTGLPTRTAQGDIAFAAGLSHGDTKHILLLPASVERVLHDGHRGLRPGRAVPDADLRDDRPRPRHEHVDGRAVPVSRGAARPRQGARRRRRCRRSASGAGTRTWTATASRTASLPGSSAAVLLHPRVGPQRQGAVQRADRRLHRQHRSAAAQVRHGARGRAAAGDRPAPRREGRPHRLRHVALGDRREPRPAARRAAGSRPRTSGCVRSRSPRISGRSSTPTTASTWWSRTATARCWA